MPDPTARKIQLSDQSELNLLEAGSGTPLLMLPGWSQTAAMFKHQLADLQDICRVLALDHRGHGDSSKAEHGYTVQRLAADVREVILQLDLEDVVILGHSLGCSVIWAYWQLYGADHLARVILLDEPAMLTINPAWSDKVRLEKAALFSSDELWKSCNDLTGPDGIATTDAFVRNLLSPQLTEEEQKWIVAENLKMPRWAAAELPLQPLQPGLVEAHSPDRPPHTRHRGTGQPLPLARPAVDS